MTTMEFFNTIAPFAIKEQRRSGVLASVTLAQGALESAYGKASPGNNLFGIKATGSEKQSAQTTREFYNGQWVTIKDGFRVYDDWSGSIVDHSDFLVQNSRYAKAGFFDACKELDYKGACLALQKAGYATDPSYASKLIAIIENYNLAKYDQEGADYMISVEHANDILSILGKYWHEMEGNEAIQDYTHFLANEVRKASGQDPT